MPLVMTFILGLSNAYIAAEVWEFPLLDYSPENIIITMLTNATNLVKITVAGIAMAASTLSATVTVGYDPSAAVGNFGTPGSSSDNVAYTINLTSDASDVNLVLTPSGSVNGLDFVNLYFSTTVEHGTGGSGVGFEIGNNDTFVPGVTSPVSTAGDGITHTESAGAWDITIPWSYFETDPQGLGFTEISAENDILRLNLSQSFGYSVVGGSANFGDSRLGETSFAATIPDSGSALLMLGTTAGGLLALRRRLAC